MVSLHDSHQLLAAALGHLAGPTDVARANLALAAEEYPALDIEACLAEFDRLIEGAPDGATDAASLEQRTEALSAYLFDELGFAGNADDYYDPRNSYLNDVLSRKLGLPITLALVYLVAAERLGLEAEPVGFPGQFLVRTSRGREELLVDPLNRGKLLSVDECEALLRGLYGDEATLQPHHLEPVSPRQMLSRMIQNLRVAYLRRDDFERGLRAVEQLQLVQPADSSLLRDRGLLLARLGNYRDGLADLQKYVAARPWAEDAGLVTDQIGYLQEMIERRN